MFNAMTLLGFKFASVAALAPDDIVHAEHHDSGSAFPPFDPTYFATQIFWLLLSFALLYFLLSRIFLPRIGETIEERSSRIADDLDTASRMQADAEQAEKNYERALTDARAKAHNVAEATRQAVDTEIQAELTAADQEADKQAEAAEKRIRDVRSNAMANIESVAAETAQAAVEALTGKKPTLASAKAALN